MRLPFITRRRHEQELQDVRDSFRGLVAAAEKRARDEAVRASRAESKAAQLEEAHKGLWEMIKADSLEVFK